MASKYYKGYKFITGGKSRPGIIGVKPRSGGVVDEFKAKRLKDVGKTQKKLESQDKAIGTEMSKARDRGATRKQLVKGRKFQRDIRRAKREGKKLRKDILRIGKAKGGIANLGAGPKDKRKPKGAQDEGGRRKQRPKAPGRPTPGRPAPKLREQIDKVRPKPGIPVGGKLKKPKPGSYDYQLQETMKPDYKRKKMKEGGKALKPVDKKKNPGLAKLPTHVRNKMGYMKDGGAVKPKGKVLEAIKEDYKKSRPPKNSRKFGGGKK